MSKFCNKKKPKYCLESINPNKILAQMGFNIGKCIGEGTYSKVCLTTCNKAQHPEKLACKIINKQLAGSDFIRKFLPRELRIIRDIDHPNIVSVHEIIEIDYVIYIFMDYCRNGDLLEYIRSHGPLLQDRAKHYFTQLVSAVEYLHDMDVAHRDLKCENVLLTLNNNLKIGDFGFSRSCRNAVTGEPVLSETFCGSAAYAAPEILQGTPYDPKMYDIWALGCILYIMLSASMPYDDTNIKRMLKCQLNRTLSLSIVRPNKRSCVYVQSLLVNLLEPNANKRATIKQIKRCAWLQEPPTKRCKKVHVCSSDSNIHKFQK